MLPLLLFFALDWKADFCGHSVPYANTTYFAKGYLVVEVEVIPDKSNPLRLSAGDFRLRIDPKKEPLQPETPGMVAGKLKYSDYSLPQGVDARASSGPVIVGQPRTESRFPGDQRETRPMPRPAPHGLPEREPAKTDSEAVIEAALPEGSTLGPTKGLLYFPFNGKLKNLKSVELLWGERTIKLR